MTERCGSENSQVFGNSREMWVANSARKRRKTLFLLAQTIRKRTGLPGVAIGSASLALLKVRRRGDGLPALVRALNAVVGGAEEALVQALIALPGKAVAGARLAVTVLVCVWKMWVLYAVSYGRACL